MSKWKTVYVNSPSYTRKCDECGEEYKPRSSKDRTCGCTGQVVNRRTSQSAWDDRYGMPSIKPTADELDRRRQRERVLVGSCGCDPCPFDIRVLGYETCKEDSAFEGTQCLWHEQIRGRKNSIFVSGGTTENPIFSVDYDGPMPRFGLGELHKVAKEIGAKRK